MEPQSGRSADQAALRRASYPPKGVGKSLARWGLTLQKPVKRAYEQCPEAVEKWLHETYPAIAQRAKAEGAEIHWGDETRLAIGRRARSLVCAGGQDPGNPREEVVC